MASDMDDGNRPSRGRRRDGDLLEEDRGRVVSAAGSTLLPRAAGPVPASRQSFPAAVGACAGGYYASNWYVPTLGRDGSSWVNGSRRPGGIDKVTAFRDETGCGHEPVEPEVAEERGSRERSSGKSPSVELGFGERSAWYAEGSCSHPITRPHLAALAVCLAGESLVGRGKLATTAPHEERPHHRLQLSPGTRAGSCGLANGKVRLPPFIESTRTTG